MSAAKKPSRIAWAINQIARRHPERLKAAFDAHGAAAAAQARGDAESMRETARAYRDRLGEVVKECAGILAEAGAHLTASQARELSETVRAAIAGGAESWAQLLAGRLAEGLDIEDPFAGVDAAMPRAKTRGEADERATAASRERQEKLAREARERAVQEVRRRVEGLEQEARQARTAARQAEVAATRAQAEAERARRAVAEIDDRLDQARREWQKLH